MKPIDARSETYMLVDTDGYICLFTNSRLDRNTVPSDLHCYDVRDNDCDGTFAEIAPFVLVNHWGTIICKDKIPMDEEWHCYWPDAEEKYIDESMSLEEFHQMSKDELKARVQAHTERIKVLEERMQDAITRASNQQGAEDQKLKPGPTR